MQPLRSLLMISTLAVAYGQGGDLMTQGASQLQAARAARNDEAYQQAEQSFDKAFAEDTGNAKALYQRGSVRMERSGLMAQQGKFGPANELMQSAETDMERAVAMAPDQIELRLMRGVMYSYFPPFLNKTAIALRDLDAVVHHSQFANLPQDKRSRAWLSLGMARASSGDGAKAAEAFRGAIDADPDSGTAKDARERLGKLDNPTHPDRFARIPAETSPLIAAASITFPNARAGQMPESMERIIRQLDGYPGLLGKHVTASVDNPGMYIIFTWWKDKKALNQWFYGDLHQGWMRQRGKAMSGEVKTSMNEMPSQVAMEVFAGLPGGVQVNGGFIPRALFEAQQK